MVMGIVNVNAKTLADILMTIKLLKEVGELEIIECKIQTISDTQIGVSNEEMMFEIIVLFKSPVLSENFGFIIPKFNPVPNREENIPDKLPLMLAITGNNASIPTTPTIVGVISAHNEPVIKLPSTTILNATDASFNNLISGF
jgi:hypothetical protein